MIELDAPTVIRAAEARKVHPLLLERQNLADDLLVGLEDLDPSFRSWLLAKRHTERDRLLRALENARAKEVSDLAVQGKYPAGHPESGRDARGRVRRLMRARAMMDDTAGAPRVYKTLWDLLDEE